MNAVKVLVVGDNPVDVLYMEEALEDTSSTKFAISRVGVLRSLCVKSQKT
jgi:hypothetical protein